MGTTRRWLVGAFTVIFLVATAGFLLLRELNETRRRLDEMTTRWQKAAETRDQALESLEVTTKRMGRAERQLTRVGRRAMKLSKRIDRLQCFSDDAGGKAGFRRGPIRGDVDGDGKTDRVWAVSERYGLEECLYFLRLRTAQGTVHQIRVTGFVDDTSARYYFDPQLMAEIDGEPGLDVVVDLHRGASTEFAAVFTIEPGPPTGEDFIRMEIQGETPDDNGFAYSGSLGAGGGVDCVEGETGRIVASTYGRAGNGYDVTRRFYEVEGSNFSLTGSENHRVSRLGVFPEFGYPFEHCRQRIPAKGTR